MNGEDTTAAELSAARRAAPRPATAAATRGAAAQASNLLPLLGIAKDGLDWVLDLFLIGEIPFAGQLPGALFTLLIVAAAWQRSGKRRGPLTLAAAALLLIIDNGPIVNNLPLTTIATFLL